MNSAQAMLTIGAGKSVRPVSILTYHHFAATDGGPTRHLGITTRPDRLAAQLEYIARTYNVISLDQLLAGDIPPRALLITIDDAYRSVIEVVAPMFSERGLPAVLFVNPRPVTEAFVPVDIVISLLGGPQANAAVRQTVAKIAGDERAGMQPNALPPGEREAVKAALIASLGETEADLHRRLGLFLSPDDVRNLPRYGVEVANHTMSHSLCRTLSAAECHQEIAVAKDAIEDLTGRPVAAFAFPWGQSADATPEVLDVIRRSGHRATFLMQGLDNSARPAPDIWYRCLITSERPAMLAVNLRLKPRLRALLRGLPGLPGLPPAQTR